MSLEELRGALADGEQHLGDLVWWSLSDARVDCSTLETIWTGASLDPAFLPELPTDEKALKIAVREKQVGLKEQLIRLGKQDETEIVFGVVREHHLPDGSLSYTQEARISLDRKASAIATDSPRHEVAVGVIAAFRQLRHTHTADDVRRSMIRVLDSCSALTLRGHGGVYWVPAPHAQTARRLRQAIEQIGGSRVHLLPVHRSREARKTLGEVAKGAIEQELDALKAEIDGFLATPPERSSTLVRRFDAFDAIRSRAELYRQILQVQVDDLDLRLGEMTAAVESLLEQKTAA